MQMTLKNNCDYYKIETLQMHRSLFDFKWFFFLKKSSFGAWWQTWNPFSISWDDGLYDPFYIEIFWNGEKIEILCQKNFYI